MCIRDRVWPKLKSKIILGLYKCNYSLTVKGVEITFSPLKATARLMWPLVEMGLTPLPQRNQRRSPALGAGWEQDGAPPWKDQWTDWRDGTRG